MWLLDEATLRGGRGRGETARAQERKERREEKRVESFLFFLRLAQHDEDLFLGDRAVIDDTLHTAHQDGISPRVPRNGNVPRRPSGTTFRRRKALFRRLKTTFHGCKPLPCGRTARADVGFLLCSLTVVSAGITKKGSGRNRTNGRTTTRNNMATLRHPLVSLRIARRNFPAMLASSKTISNAVTAAGATFVTLTPSTTTVNSQIQALDLAQQAALTHGKGLAAARDLKADAVMTSLES